MRAKKSLGQHFLRSERALAKIVETGEISPQDIVLEIGPGQGALTEKLLVVSRQVIAVEKDDELYGFLKTKFDQEIDNKKLILIHGDILGFEIKNYLLPTTYYKLIANIPYNITGAILEKFLSQDFQPKRMVLLVQKEVAKRVCGHRVSTGRGKESILSISVKAYGSPRYIETVKAGSFVPMPNVDSAIIAIENISKEFFHSFTEQDFFSIVRSGFKSKRKKLLSNLSTIWNKGVVKNAFRELNLSENLRAEELGKETWQKLAIKLLSTAKSG